jgi:hypothetical protein
VGRLPTAGRGRGFCGSQTRAPDLVDPSTTTRRCAPAAGGVSPSCWRSAARRAATRWGGSRAWGDSRPRGVAGASAGRRPALRFGGSFHDTSEVRPAAGGVSPSCWRSAARRAAARWGGSRAWGDSRPRGVAGASAGRRPALRFGGSFHDTSEVRPAAGGVSPSCWRSAARRAAARWGGSRAWGDSRPRGVAGASASRGPALRVGGSVHDSSEMRPTKNRLAE